MKMLVGSFTDGFMAPLRGTRLILSNSRIRRLAVIPFLITLVTFLVGIGWGFGQLTLLVPWTADATLSLLDLTRGSFFHSVLYWLILFVSWPVAIFALLYFLFLISRVIATPFYALLAERVLIETGVMEDLPFRMGEWLRVNVKLLGVAVLKLLVFAVVGTVLFLLSFIPGFGLVTGFGFLLMAAYDIVDISLEALQLGFGRRIDFFRSQFPAFTGLAFAMGLVFLVPGLNFFLFPAAVAGGGDVVRRLGQKAAGKAVAKSSY